MRGLKGCLSVAVSEVALTFCVVLFLIIDTRTTMVTTVNRVDRNFVYPEEISLAFSVVLNTKLVVQAKLPLTTPTETSA